MIKDTINTAPRWFLTLWILVTTPLGATAGTLAFNLIMYELARMQDVYGEPTREEIAMIKAEQARLDRRVIVLELQMPNLAQKVDKIDANVEKLLKRR